MTVTVTLDCVLVIETLGLAKGKMAVLSSVLSGCVPVISGLAPRTTIGVARLSAKSTRATALLLARARQRRSNVFKLFDGSITISGSDAAAFQARGAS